MNVLTPEKRMITCTLERKKKERKEDRRFVCLCCFIPNHFSLKQWNPHTPNYRTNTNIQVW